MPFMLQIAGGIILAVVGVVVLYAALCALGDWVDGRYIRKARRRNRREARKKAAASGKQEP